MSEYNLVKYQVGTKGLSNWSGPKDLDDGVTLITQKARNVGPPYRFSDDGHDFGPKRTIPELKAILTTKATAADVGDRLFLSAGDGAKVFILRKVLTNLEIIDTTGTPRIDLIYSAVLEKFPSVISWGICNCRPIAGSSTWSQHAWCNAWDIHATATVMQQIYDFFAEEGREGRLPIAHDIYNRKIWTPSEGTHGYGGDNPHTDHVHVDAAPNFTGTPPCA